MSGSPVPPVQARPQPRSKVLAATFCSLQPVALGGRVTGVQGKTWSCCCKEKSHTKPTPVPFFQLSYSVFYWPQKRCTSTPTALLEIISTGIGPTQTLPMLFCYAGTTYHKSWQLASVKCLDKVPGFFHHAHFIVDGGLQGNAF